MKNNSKARKTDKAQAECPDFAVIIRQSTPDSSLFEQIAECFADRLEEYARWVCRDDTKGQDAFQDAMIAAMANLKSYRGDSPIEAWLQRIVVSACGRIRRGQKNNPAANIPLDAVIQDPALTDSGRSQELQLILTERLEMVRAQIEKLEEPNRSLLKLHDLEEIPIAELAHRFDLTAEAVKSRLKRARTRVREQLLETI